MTQTRRNPGRAVRDGPISLPMHASPNGRLTRSSVLSRRVSSEASSDHESAITLATNAAIARINGGRSAAAVSNRRARLRGSSARLSNGSSSSPSRVQRQQRPRASQNGQTNGSPLKTARTVRTHNHLAHSDFIWPMHRVEFGILVRVLEYAVHPFESKDAVQWLLAAGRTCKAFHDAAVKVLFSNPPPLGGATTNMSARLIALLRDLTTHAKEAEDRRDFRRTMVKSLVIDVDSTVGPKKVPLHLAGLLGSLPRLVDVDLYHEYDQAPYRKLDIKTRWQYPRELIPLFVGKNDAQEKLRLKRWKWSGRFMTESALGIHVMASLHHGPVLRNLTDLTFVNFQVPSLHKNEDPEKPEVLERDVQYIHQVAQAITASTFLRSLRIESSTIVDGELLNLLPDSLETLEIINCWELKAEDLTTYLRLSGGQLRRLVLDHNQSLSLGFFPYLGISCPSLEELYMNLTYYRHHESYHDSEPLYDVLLSSDQTPTWPENIRTISLEYLRRWDGEAAEVFLRSLITAAPRLPMLRNLILKATLDIPWRDRSTFRERWQARMRRTFLRESTGPRPFFSLKQWPAIKAAENAASSAQLPVQSPTAPIAVELSRSSVRKKRAQTTTDAPSIARSSKRARQVSYREPDSDEDLESEEQSQDGTAGTSLDREDIAESGEPEPDFIHGLCEVVDIRIDNQKPQEFQYDMDDFLDQPDEDDVDDDWDEGHEIDDEDGTAYAW